MQGKARKIVQAILYEAIAVACVAPALLQLGVRTLGSASAQA
jgi:uncharacterized membrane protein